MGTSLLVLCQVYPVWDHPHAYGDKALLLSKTNSHQGSSPRVWGQAELVTIYGDVYRIIPTRMGTRIANDRVAALLQDHPHAYGDKNTSVNQIDNFIGSSPRVWGQVAYRT